jgi:hypothetical protein
MHLVRGALLSFFNGEVTILRFRNQVVRSNMKLYILMYNNEPLETYNDQEDAMAQFECEMEQVGGTEALHIRLVTVEVEKV